MRPGSERKCAVDVLFEASESEGAVEDRRRWSRRGGAFLSLGEERDTGSHGSETELRSEGGTG